MLATCILAAVIASPADALQRVDPCVYEVTFGKQYLRAGECLHLPPSVGDLAMPILDESKFFEIDDSSMSLRLKRLHQEDPTFASRCSLERGFPFVVRLGRLLIPQFSADQLEWSMSYRIRSWSSVLDDMAASEVAWPREWPADVMDALQPQTLIESDDPIFAQAVQTAVGEDPRLRAPYFVARDVVAYCVDNFRVGGPRGTFYVGDELIGLRAVGASTAIQNGIGTEHDLVCVCVATLRAAGIPARPVTGFKLVQRVLRTRDKSRGISLDPATLESVETFVRTGEFVAPEYPDVIVDECGHEIIPDDHPTNFDSIDVVERAEFVTWGEFLLPDVGWVPFDPNVMRRYTGSREGRWPGFGTVRELNERVAIAHHLTAPGTPEQRAEELFRNGGSHTPWAWGWLPDDHDRRLPAIHQIDVEMEEVDLRRPASPRGYR